MAIGRMVSKDDMDPKMGVLAPCVFEKVDCLLWVQVCDNQIGEGWVLIELTDAFRG